MWKQEHELSKFGKWAWKNELTQGDVKAISGLSHVTVSSLFNDPDYKGTSLTRRTLISSLQSQGFNVDEYDFW